jgi:hypothetical protein
VSRNDTEDFAQRLYARIPENYRVYDQEQGQPLLALVQVIAEQVANLRQNLDDLWDDFFIETCRDWVVPYIGALVGTNLLANPVGRSNRLEVRDTVLWRRSKGTVAMLAALANEISGWSADIAEFFRSLGWSQNMNHLRLERPLTADLRDPYLLSLLGHANDPFAHAPDFKPAHDLDEARTTQRSPVIGSAGWGTPGRYQIKNLGFFMRRLAAFAVHGAMPAAVDPGAAAPPGAAYFTFDPLHREIPLFTETNAAPVTRAAFDHAPWQFFGTDITVRQFGIPLAVTSQPQPNVSSSTTPFIFGGSAGTLALDARSGMRLLGAREFQLGAAHFVITALWQGTGASPTNLGALSSLLAARGDPEAFRLGAAAAGAGRLVMTVVAGHAGLGWDLPSSPPARFPGAVVAVRASQGGAPHVVDARYVYLPPAFVSPTSTLTYHVADDGSTYTDPRFSSMSLARASEGQIYPSVIPVASPEQARTFQLISRMPGALRLADPSRVAGVGLLIQAELFTGIFQPQGAIVTIDQPAGRHPDLQPPTDPWRAFTFAAARNAPPDNVPNALLTIFLQTLPLQGDFVPSCELIVRGRGGQSLLIYLPEISQCPATGVRLFVAKNGSTWKIPANPQLDAMLDAGDLARPASGQMLPIAGNWPLQYRRPVAIDLCRSERSALLQPGELGIDPELGRFALAPGDPAIPGIPSPPVIAGAGTRDFSVDYVEAFPDRVGALTYDRMLDPARHATRLVSLFGEAPTPLTATPPPPLPVHASLAAAVAAAADGDIIEILDSATYAATDAIVLGNSRVKTLTIRAAAGHRPCLTFYRAPSTPAPASFRVAVAMDSFELNGLLLSGGPLLVESKVSALRLEACTLDPRLGSSLLAADLDLNDRAAYLLCRCVAGGLQTGDGVAQLTIADSIIDQSGSIALAGLLGVGSPPIFSSPPLLASPPSSPPQIPRPAARNVQLERVTVLGRIHCEVLSASESILDDVAVAEDRQSGCIRFSRFETGSLLPRRYQCVPSEQDEAECPSGGRCLAPFFNSRRFGRPDYLQLAAATPAQILSASEQHSEIGAFAGALNTVRLGNLRAKLKEFMPVGLEPVIIAET